LAFASCQDLVQLTIQTTYDGRQGSTSL